MGTRKHLATGGDGTGEGNQDEFGLFQDLPWQPEETEYGANPLAKLREHAIDELLLRLMDATATDVALLVDFVIAAAEGKYSGIDDAVVRVHDDVLTVLAWDDEQLRGYFNEVAKMMNRDFDDKDGLLNAARDRRLDW